MRRLFVPGPWRAGMAVTIAGEEAHHGRSVLRLREGDVIGLLDGAGAVAEARVLAVKRHELQVRVESVLQHGPRPGHKLTMAVAPPKGNRYEAMLRSLTELGVGCVRPLACERGQRVPGGNRAERVVVEACKQSARPHLMQVGPVLDFTGLSCLSGQLIMLDPTGTVSVPVIQEATTICVGPEGGFTDTERQTLIDHGAIPLRLATDILRIETAAIAGAAVWMSAHIQDLGQQKPA